MKGCARILFVILAWFSLFGWAGPSLQAELPPAPTRWMTDQAGRLSPEVRAQLDHRLAAYQQATGHHVLVWIGSSTGEIPLEDWVVRTFESWKVGRAGMDDGLVLFVLAEDRKLRIEVGYGLEGQMPDLLASRIIREAITPRLGQGDWDGAVSAGVDGILQVLGGEKASSGQGRVKGAPKKLGLGEMVIFGLLGLGFLILLVTNPSLAVGLLFSILSGGRGGGGGGGGGGWSGGGGRSGGGGASGSW